MGGVLWWSFLYKIIRNLLLILQDLKGHINEVSYGHINFYATVATMLGQSTVSSSPCHCCTHDASELENFDVLYTKHGFHILLYLTLHQNFIPVKPHGGISSLVHHVQF